jgi:glycosyltransferase involved in cell wall biosynthesis
MGTPSPIYIPLPPSGKFGWPWQTENRTLTHQKANGKIPKISIITPSFNQAHFLEETIRSVLLQNYPIFEYIIIDGGSTDGSVDIIRKYEPWLSFWVSEPDNGQCDAINKGLKHCTGEIVAWINSDDYYNPNVFSKIAEEFLKDSSLGLIFGNIQVFDASGKLSNPISYRHPPSRMLYHLEIPYQPASFFKTSILQRIGPLDASFHYVMDVDLLLRAMTVASYKYLPLSIAIFRIHKKSKTFNAEANFAQELLRLREIMLNQLNQYPALADFNPRQISSNFYRLAAKHYYLARLFSKSAYCLWSACRESPPAIFSIIGDEGIKWFIALFIPISLYRKFSHFFRSRFKTLWH